MLIDDRLYSTIGTMQPTVVSLIDPCVVVHDRTERPQIPVLPPPPPKS